MDTTQLGDQLIELASAIGRARQYLREAEDRAKTEAATHKDTLARVTGGFDYAGSGPNKDARDIALRSYLADNAEILDATDALDRAESDRDVARVNLETLVDERRSIEWAIRARMVDAYASHRHASGAPDRAMNGATDDALFDVPPPPPFPPIEGGS